MFKIEFTSEAFDDLHFFKKHEKRKIIKEIEMQLSHQPIDITRNRKRLRPNDTSWELESIEYFMMFLKSTRLSRLKQLGLRKEVNFLSRERSINYENNNRIQKRKKRYGSP